MEQGSDSQNKMGGFSRKNQIYTLIGVLLLAGIIFLATRGSNPNSNVADNQDTNQQQNEQNQNTQNSGEIDNNSGQVSGNLNISGTLKTSDNPARGNLMLESASGKIYVSTSRDFANLIGQNVTLNAEGTFNNFKFLGFNSTIQPDNSNQPDVGGAPEEEVTESRNFTFTGSLEKSNSSLGNYMISSGKSRIYLQSVRDYSAWLGSQVTLSATGSIESFNNAILTK